MQYYDPLREGYERVWRYYGMGQKPSLDPRDPPPVLPFWDLTDCNDVNRTSFSHMGLSLRTQQPGSIEGGGNNATAAAAAAAAAPAAAATSGGGGSSSARVSTTNEINANANANATNGTAWRLTIWYEWNGTALAPDWLSRSHPDSTAALELYDHAAAGPGGDADPAFFDSPAEANNLAYDPAYADVLGRLTEKLERLFGRYVDG